MNKGVIFSFSPNLVFLWKGSKGYKRGRLCPSYLGKRKETRESPTRAPRRPCLNSPEKGILHPPPILKKSYFFGRAASYMRILYKHSIYLIFFCNFLYAVGH